MNQLKLLLFGVLLASQGIPRVFGDSDDDENDDQVITEPDQAPNESRATPLDPKEFVNSLLKSRKRRETDPVELLETLRKRLRRAASDVPEESPKLWDLPIHYHIDEKLSAKAKKQIDEAILWLEDHTCLEFDEVPKDHEGDSILFTKAIAHCTSPIGKQGGQQKIQISDDKSEGCLSLAMMSHEIFHSLGIEHEVKRPDRDQWIKVNEKEVTNPDQFKKEKTLNFDPYPYDFLSVEHYDDKYLRSSQDATTFEVIDPLLEYWVKRSVKTYSAPSFYDIKIINNLYGCLDSCKKQNCKNNGFKVRVETTNKCTCECPKGTRGKFCQKREAKCGKIYKKKKGTIKSKKFAKTLMDKKQHNKICSWEVQTNKKHIVHLSFYDAAQSAIAGDYASDNYLEVRKYGITLPGIRKGGWMNHTEMAFAIPGSAYIELGIKNNNGYGVGFKANFQVFDAKAYEKCNKVCYNGGELLLDKCECSCRPDYKGDTCQEFKNSNCDITLPCENYGVLDPSEDDCPCTCPKRVDGMHSAISGDRCQYYGDCYKRNENAALVTQMTQSPAQSEDPSCAKMVESKQLQCHNPFYLASCPVSCNTQCDCINYLDTKIPDKCADQKAQCEMAPAMAMMSILCQNTCGSCPALD